MPDTAPTVPIAVLLLLHEPPVLASVSDIADATHTLVVPVIAAGKGLTVTVKFVKQPVGST